MKALSLFSYIETQTIQQQYKIGQYSNEGSAFYNKIMGDFQTSLFLSCHLFLSQSYTCIHTRGTEDWTQNLMHTRPLYYHWNLKSPKYFSPIYSNNLGLFFFFKNKYDRKEKCVREKCGALGSLLGEKPFYKGLHT